MESRYYVVLALLVSSAASSFAMITSVAQYEQPKADGSKKEVAIVGVFKGTMAAGHGAMPQEVLDAHKTSIFNLIKLCKTSEVPSACVLLFDKAEADRYPGFLQELGEHMSTISQEGTASFFLNRLVPYYIEQYRFTHAYMSEIYKRVREKVGTALMMQSVPSNLKPVMATLLSYPSDIEDVEKFLKENKQARSLFFAEGLSLFACFKAFWIDALFAPQGDHVYTLAECLNEHSKHMAELKQFAADLPEESPFKVPMLDQLDLAESQYGKMRTSFKTYARNLDVTCKELHVAMMEQKRSFLDATHEQWEIYQGSFLPMVKALQLKAFAELLGKYDRVVCIGAQYPQVESLYEEFKKLPFQARLHGLQRGTNFAHPGLPIAYKGLDDFFSTKALDCIFEDLFKNTMLSREVAGGDAVQAYSYDHGTNTMSEESFYVDQSLACFTCGKTQSAYYYYCLGVRADTTYCSFPCFIGSFVEKERTGCPSLSLLHSDTCLSGRDKKTLARCATLIHYFKLLVHDSSLNEQGEVYKICDKVVIEHIKRILAVASGAQDEDSQSWKDALDIVGAFGVDCRKLCVLFGVAATLKKEYLKAMLKQVGRRAYKEVSAEIMVPFDPDNKLNKVQKLLISQLAKHLALASKAKREEHMHETVRQDLLLLFDDLMTLFLERLGKEDFDYASLLRARVGVVDAPIPADLLEMFEHSRRPNKRLPKKEKARFPKAQPKKEEKSTAPVALAPMEEMPVSLNVVCSDENDTRPFIAVTKKKRASVMKEFNGYFHGVTPYKVRLYKAKPFFEESKNDNSICRLWSSNPSFRYDERIKLLFALYYQDEYDSIQELPEHGLLLTLPDHIKKEIDASIADKVDLHHLFTEQVDGCLTSCGIVETTLAEKNSIQVSIPGEIRRRDGIPSIGFFQYTFKRVASDWICIHRCFRYYTSSLNNKHVSISLRRALFDYLKTHYSDNPEYADVIKGLANILE